MVHSLYHACAHGDTRAALALIESNADVDAIDDIRSAKTTPLHAASGHCEIVAALIESNARGNRH
jgi:ankyrin repeat protein